MKHKKLFPHLANSNLKYVCANQAEMYCNNNNNDSKISSFADKVKFS